MSTFQREHYVKIAKVIADLVDNLPKGERALVAAKFATTFLKDNPRFNEKRFYEACGLPSELRAALAGVAKLANERADQAAERALARKAFGEIVLTRYIGPEPTP